MTMDPEDRALARVPDAETPTEELVADLRLLVEMTGAGMAAGVIDEDSDEELIAMTRIVHELDERGLFDNPTTEKEA